MRRIRTEEGAYAMEGEVQGGLGRSSKFGATNLREAKGSWFSIASPRVWRLQYVYQRIKLQRDVNRMSGYKCPFAGDDLS